METKVERRLAKLFEEAEANRKCATCPPDSPNRKAILRRIPHDITSPARGMYARTAHWSNLSRTEKAMRIARTLAELHPTWVFCGPTAAAAHRLETPQTLLANTYIVSKCASNPSSTIRRLDSAGFEPCVAQGIPVTDPLTSAIDCLRIGSFPESLAIADSALRKLSMLRSDFEKEVLVRLKGKHRAREGRRAARYASALSENGGESYARGVMIEEGFCIPRLQVEIPDPIEPGRSYRVDYLWTAVDGTPIIGELDGRDKLRDPDMLKGRTLEDAVRAERTRESRLSITGARIFRFTFEDVLNRRRFASTLQAFGVPFAKRRGSNAW